MSALYITVDGYGGRDIAECCVELVALATRLGVDAHGKFNGVQLIAAPGTNADVLYKNWNAELKSGRPYKIAVSWNRPEATATPPVGTPAPETLEDEVHKKEAPIK